MNLEKIFIHRIQKLKSKTSTLTKKLNRLSILRIIFFASSIFSSIFIYTLKNISNYFYLIPFILFLIFFFLFKLFSKISFYKSRLSLYLKLILEEEKRFKLEIENFYDYEIGFNKYNKNCIYANDLGLLGKNGLINYLNITKTKQGEENFYNSILGNKIYSVQEIEERQKLIEEISFSNLKLIRILNENYLDENTNSKIDISILRKVNLSSYSLPTVIKHSFKPYIIIVWLSVLILFLLDLPNLVSTMFFLNTIFFILFKRKNSSLLKKFEKLNSSILPLKNISAYLIGIQFDSIKLNQKISRKQSNKIFYSLEKIFGRISIQNSPLMHYLLNMLFLWDLWQLSSFEKWTKNNINFIEEILDSVLKIDSILAFSNIKFLNPEFQFPKIDEKFNSIQAVSISHPLIKNQNRISNPLGKTKFGESWIITGSNMSGKTTYLRTIGINVLLGNIGSVVSCTNLEMPPIKILTSIKNEDSLENGISFFYSEVKRIGEILKNSKTEKSLILLDELLKGTNTRERLIASKEIIKELSKTNSFIFITTHDIDLAKKTTKQKLAFFQEKIENKEMSFDYRIKSGIIKSTNALKILELENIGLKF